MNRINPLLSVIIISKNEEKFICRCIESVTTAVNGIDSKEIILIDSASTDGTLRLACQYNISIVQLRPQWRHTPAAGRYIGFKRSSGQFLLFVDGDCCLMPGFVERAIELFGERTIAGAIVGRRKEIYYKNGIVVGERENTTELPDHVTPIEVTAGNSIYRRSALEIAGAFDPYLFSEEEAELSYRMRQARYEILGIPIDMIVHNTLPRDSLITYMSRMKSNLHLGPGQIMRNALTRGITRGHLRRISSGLRFLAWIFIGLIVFMLSLNWKTNMLFLLWIAASVFFYFLFAAKSRDMMKPARYAILWTLQSHSIIRGFLLKPYKPESYPTDVIVVKNST